MKTTAKKLSNGDIMLTGVRCNFPHLQTLPQWENAKYQIDLLIPESAKDARELLEEEVDRLVKEKCKGKRPEGDFICIKKGEREEEKGYWRVRAKSNDPIKVLNSAGEVLAGGQDGGIYGGCYVRAKIAFWGTPQSKGGGNVKKATIGAQAVAVQFQADGEAFTASHVSNDRAAEGFEVDEGSAFDMDGDDDEPGFKM